MSERSRRAVDLPCPGLRTTSISRRQWLGYSVMVLPGLGSPAWGQAVSGADVAANEREVIDQVRTNANKAGLALTAVTRSEHFLGLGNAPAVYSERALKICESLTKDFLAYFQERGFPVAFPGRRLTVVALKDHASYGAYIGKVPDPSVGGHYDPGS